MKIKNTTVTQILFYLLVIEFILVIVSIDDKYLIAAQIMKPVMIITFALFVLSIIYFLWNIKKHKS